MNPVVPCTFSYVTTCGSGSNFSQQSADRSAPLTTTFTNIYGKIRKRYNRNYTNGPSGSGSMLPESTSFTRADSLLLPGLV